MTGALRPPAIALLLAVAVAGAAPLAQEAQRRRGFAIKITQPVAGDIAVGKMLIKAEVKADRPELVESVEFHVDDQLVFRDTEPPYECSYDFGPQSVARVIRAVATHTQGVTVSDIIVTRRIDLSFSVRVNRVLLNAAVLDREDHFVLGLGARDLIVLEEGKERPIIDFSLETRPLSVALLMDTSGSMQEKIRTAQQAAGAFVDSLGEQDQAMVIDFSDSVFLLQDLTSDRRALRTAIEGTTAIGSTAIFDAVHAALRKMRTFEGRKAIVLLSDGGDTSSQFTRQRVVEEAKAADVTIYSIGLGTGDFDLGSKSLLKELSETTGGRALFPSDVAELAGSYRTITEDLRNQYYITYESPNEAFDGRWISIEIRARQPGLHVRARKGYFAIQPGS